MARSSLMVGRTHCQRPAHSANAYQTSASAISSAVFIKSSAISRIFSINPVTSSASMAAAFSPALRTSLSKSINRVVVKRILPAIVCRWINPPSGCIMTSARADGTSMKYPRILLYLIFRVWIPVWAAYSACNAAIVSLAPWDNPRIWSSAASNPSRITPPSRKNVGNSSLSANFNSPASLSWLLISAKRAAISASNERPRARAPGNANRKSDTDRISRGVPRPDSKRVKLRPTSGIAPSICANPPIASMFSNKWPMCSWRRRISPISADSVRRYDRNRRAPAAVLVWSNTSSKHAPPSLMGASISRLFHVAESISNWRPDLKAYGARNAIGASRWVLNKYPASNATTPFGASPRITHPASAASTFCPNTRDTIWPISVRLYNFS